MKLQNKETGKIGYLYVNKDEDYNVLEENGKVLAVYATLTEVADEWQDYEEPKGIQDVYNVKSYVYVLMSSEEEAEKAVEKLKAWQRLKDNGFEFTGWKRDEKYYGDFTITATDQTSCNDKDLDLLFGGE